jgi:hypothetical protein
VYGTPWTSVLLLMNSITLKSLVVAFVAIVSSLISNLYAQATIVVQKNVVLNGAATSTSNTTPDTVFVSPTGAASLNNFGVAYEILLMHPTTGAPVNVQDFKVLSATHTLKKEGVNTTWVNIAAGSYNPPGDSSRPDFVVRNSSGAQTSVNLTAVVGTVVPTAHKFQVLDFNVPLGTAARPKLVSQGQYYTLIRDISFEYKYLNVLYTKTLSEQVRVEVVDPTKVLPETLSQETKDEFINSPGGFKISFQVSQNLQNWFLVSVPLPVPFSGSVADTIALLPANQTVAGLTRNDLRFYRFIFETID